MHELRLAEDVLYKIKEEARQRGITKVSRAKIRVGETLISDPPELKEIFSTLSIGSVADGAELEIEISPLKARCTHCQREIISRALRLDCPHCGSTASQIYSGRELKVEDLQ